MVADPLPPGQIHTRGWPVLHAGSVPRDLAPPNWTLRVHGEVEHPATIGFADLLRLPQKEQVCDIHCVTSWSKVGMRWSGVPFQALVERVRPTAAARYVIMECEQRFTTSLPLAALLDDDVLLAHSADGAPLSSEHGGPVRMLVPKRYFYKSAKWLRGLRFVTEDEPGFWEVRGYSNIADPWRETRYDVDDKRLIYKMRKDALFKPVAPTSSDP
ncbi:MAG TPA: sulfite oxidase-like oxidoreductase [Thermoplasmata archaeon]|nr:sulfite oxidase-like oxidoreductase [Thermoplasmata archaeon]